MILEAEGAIEKLRKLMGATDPGKAEAGTIRKQFGSNIERNAIHGSDGPETFDYEMSYFFSQLEIV
jgi:nucleoside-diphosphate kinase